MFHTHSTPQAALTTNTTTANPPHPLQRHHAPGDVWHVALPRLDPRLLYGFRVSGPNQDKSRGADGRHDDAAAGHRCDEVRCRRAAAAAGSLPLHPLP